MKNTNCKKLSHAEFSIKFQHINFQNGSVYRIFRENLYGNSRIRLFYGDVETGLDWEEEYDTMGYLGNSTGSNPCFILLNNGNSLGGSAILEGCIVKITIDKKVVYQHPNYHLRYSDRKILKNEDAKFPFGVYGNFEDKQENLSNFGSREKAEKWILFIEGERNSK